MRRPLHTVLGLDLSLNAPAGVILPARWRPGQWQLPTLVITPIKPEEDLDAFHARRTGHIARELLKFAVRHGVTDVYVEGYAFGAKQSREVLAELGGVVRDYFLRRSRDVWSTTTGQSRPPSELIVRPVPGASARKLLLGRVPSKKKSGIAVKEYVNHQLAKMGAKFASMDEGDAFVVANYGRMLLGLSCISVDTA